MSKSTETYTEVSDKIRSRDLFFALLFSEVVAAILPILLIFIIFIASFILAMVSFGIGYALIYVVSWNFLFLETVVVFTFIPYPILGQILARKGLETGNFGYWTCVGTGILIAVSTVCVGAIASFGFATISTISFPLLLATASAFGALEATLFWIFITRRYPELVPHWDNATGVVIAAFVVMYGAAVIGDPVQYALGDRNKAFEIMENNVNLIPGLSPRIRRPNRYGDP